jgi:3-deoxy-D-manno-octulosonic acid kinase
LKIHTKNSKSHVLIFLQNDPSSSSNIKGDWFDCDHWQQRNAIIGQSRGRHITWFIQPPQELDDSAWVLRHYYRGGLIAKLTDDQFVYTGMKQTRGFREVSLLQTMLEMGLPVPKPIGARVTRKGLFYTADLLMEKIQAKDLVAKLKVGRLSEELWGNVGKTIASFHQKGIYHADLNAHNILLDEAEQCWLIDFDRCEQRAIHSDWQQQNIQRLKRSFVKEQELHPQFYFDDNSWQCLLAGYQS